MSGQHPVLTGSAPSRAETIWLALVVMTALAWVLGALLPFLLEADASGLRVLGLVAAALGTALSPLSALAAAWLLVQSRRSFAVTRHGVLAATLALSLIIVLVMLSPSGRAINVWIAD
jgi:hypothetical protein